MTVHCVHITEGFGLKLRPDVDAVNEYRLLAASPALRMYDLNP